VIGVGASGFGQDDLDSEHSVRGALTNWRSIPAVIVTISLGVRGADSGAAGRIDRSDAGVADGVRIVNSGQ
jgi:hypothetical protein